MSKVALEGSLSELKKQEKRHIMCKEKQKWGKCYELCSENFNLTVLIRPIFRLQYLAGSIQQFIFPLADMNDLIQTQMIFMKLN